jgi:hypothetical protein
LFPASVLFCTTGKKKKRYLVEKWRSNGYYTHLFLHIWGILAEISGINL